MKPYDEANQYLRDNLEAVCGYLFPGGKQEGKNFLVGNVNGQAGRSFVIALEPADKRGLYKDFAGGKGSRNLCGLWKDVRGIPTDNYARFFQDLEQYAGRSFGWNASNNNGAKPSFQDWPRWLAQFSKADALRLASHPKRQYKLETVLWFHTHEHLGLYRGHITFAMYDETGNVVGVHRWIEAEAKLKFLGTVTLLVIGDPATATECDIHESTWDLIAELDRTAWHLDPTKLFICTRGAGNWKLVKDRIPPYGWHQYRHDLDRGRSVRRETIRTRPVGFPVRFGRICRGKIPLLWRSFIKVVSSGDPAFDNRTVSPAGYACLEIGYLSSIG